MPIEITAAYLFPFDSLLVSPVLLDIRFHQFHARIIVLCRRRCAPMPNCRYELASLTDFSALIPSDCASVFAVMNRGGREQA